ncbi:hypothetical protein EV193_102818 [Herbihabitans rhizosphaerae]|uniref:AAA+ ATPase domain-containing protein n=2 Tax=Herbihabitans rhizosphaerae TaxID=1872711 RepID=A0A4Q7L3M7_9PSEU|nr:hypothetical protein EV193_102818 [Herbihabitans rhizosphaerae]
MVAIAEEHEVSLFEERAENLTPEEFEAWTAPTPHDEQILRQLQTQGPKLLTGPRGCGKTTLLLRAAAEIRKRGSALPVYVNYGRSMFTEPAFNQRSDADGFFQDWLVAKVIAAMDETFQRLEVHAPDLRSQGEIARSFIDLAERNPHAARPDLPGPTALTKALESWAEKAKAKRIVLLLDDAAHAFVPEQQRVFFEYLRNLRTPAVTYKAAIYPGVTEFSPNFHVGHDAKLVHAWVPVEGSEYLDFMRSIYERRLPPAIRNRISVGVVLLFAAASFGVPRTFFALIETYLENWRGQPARSAQAANNTIIQNSDQLRDLHRSLSRKLPRYRQYVETGEKALDKLLLLIGELNETRHRAKTDAQALDVAIRHPIDSRLVTILGLLEYAGLVRRTNEAVSHGADRYSKFAIHGCLLVAAGALKFGQNPTMEQRANALVKTSRTGSYKRVGSEGILTPKQAEACQLVVANCAKCGTPRPMENARFCGACGAELVDASRFEELMATSIDELSLTRKKLRALHDQEMHKIEDLIRDRGLTEISKAQRIGPVWARRVYSLAEEFVGV